MITKVRFYTTQLARVVDQTSCIRSLFLNIPDDYPSFRPGHVIEIKMPLRYEDRVFSSRMYSICSLREDKAIELCVDRINEKGVSGALCHVLEGSVMEISMPEGKFTLQNSKDKPVIFVGLASGVGVLRGMTRECYKKNFRATIQFYAVNADETSIPYEKELEEDCDIHPNLEIYPIIQTGGFDTDEIVDRIFSHTATPLNWEYYIVGPYKPVNILKEHILSVGVLKKLVHVQEYH